MLMLVLMKLLLPIMLMLIFLEIVLGELVWWIFTIPISLKSILSLNLTILLFF